MAKKQKSKTATAAAAATAAPLLTLFPPGDCAAGLPANPIQHDVTFVELKKLERTIDDLPYSIVLPPREVHKLPNNGRTIKQLGTAAATSGDSVLELVGGVPVERARAANVSNLKTPAIPQVALRTLKQALARREIVVSVPG